MALVTRLRIRTADGTEWFTITITPPMILELTPEQQARVPVIVPGELRALTQEA